MKDSYKRMKWPVRGLPCAQAEYSCHSAPLSARYDMISCFGTPATASLKENAPLALEAAAWYLLVNPSAGGSNSRSRSEPFSKPYMYIKREDG